MIKHIHCASMKRHQKQSHWIIKLFENNHVSNFVFVLISLLFFIPFAGAQTRNAPLPSPPDDSSILSNQFKFSPVLGIVLVCLITAFFMMGCVSVYARQCIEAQTGNRPSPGTSIVNRHSRGTATRGLDPVAIDKFPTFLYSDVKGHKIGKAALECAVCLNEFEDGETLRLLPKCCHVFHPDCIGTWLASHVTCPVCRANLTPVAGEESDSNNVQCCDSVTESTQPTRSPEDQNQVNDISEYLAIDIHIGSPEVTNASQTINQNRSPKSTLEKSHVKGKFPRSNSTGHSLIQPGQDRERFTLRLPEEVQKKLMQPELRRAKSNVAFPSARSSKKGYRSNSVGTGRERNYNHAYYERFDREGRPDQWGFTITPPFISRTGSTDSIKEGVHGNNLMASGGLLKSVKSPFDRLFSATEKDDVGERSFTKLIGDNPV